VPAASRDKIELEAGADMLALAKKLFPLNRSLMGPDIRKSFGFFREKHSEFRLIELPTGSKVFDWEIPQEWSINEAFIEHESGQRFAIFSECNLHIMGYSTPIDKTLTKQELLTRIHTHPHDRTAIPYVTSYYKKDWAFCMSSDQVDNLPDGKYRVLIDSEFKNGHLCLQEAVIEGLSEKEIFFSSYLCHPSMANNELSGPVLLSKIMDYVKSLPDRRYTYRFVLLPETIGSIAYLSSKMDLLKRNVICGYNLSCVGDERAYSHVESRWGNNLADVALRSALLDLENVVHYSFLDRGSDERQYCGPGIDLPVCTFCRSKFGRYPEYHSSKDDFNVVTERGLGGSFAVMKTIIDGFELGIYPKINVYCEPQLGKRGLYPNTSKLYKGKHPADIRMNVIAYCDGNTTLFEISNKLSVNLKSVTEEVIILNNFDLIEFNEK
jgi:aminopeptidase-like protein